MFADLQEAVLIAYGGIAIWSASAVVAGDILLAIFIIGMGLYKRMNRD
ncbi:MAG TPA: hypothetical protein VII92_20995 [Anaerolineae bacterium]